MKAIQTSSVLKEARDGELVWRRHMTKEGQGKG